MQGLRSAFNCQIKPQDAGGGEGSSPYEFDTPCKICNANEFPRVEGAEAYRSRAWAVLAAPIRLAPLNTAIIYRQTEGQEDH